MKIAVKIIDLVNRGYGLSQLMREAGLEKKDLISLMKTNFEVNKKLKKRFKEDWLNVNYVGSEISPTDNDTPEMAELKVEAKKLGVEFHLNIRFDK